MILKYCICDVFMCKLDLERWVSLLLVEFFNIQLHH